MVKTIFSKNGTIGNKISMILDNQWVARVILVINIWHFVNLFVDYVRIEKVKK